jgi:hypothetical protein
MRIPRSNDWEPILSCVVTLERPERQRKISRVIAFAKATILEIPMI